MSFITKRERVFNEYDLFDLPARNEGKLKAYASCTDARAWSHFCSDKSEHLVEIIKRNNEKSKTQYVPTEAIVNTLLSGKNAEIARLNRKIDEFEQMLAVYEDLELTCEQKCEIAQAHAAIKEANKELNELWFDLDVSGFTGADSDGFETGKSRGDEPSRYRDEHDQTSRSKGDEWSFKPPQKESKSNQVGPSALDCVCDASTNAVDPRIEELQGTIISKDAKMSAMKNTIAMMENDVCEPYCIYVHIYTALEKIFGILCQNDKYKLYLDLMTAGKDTRCIDIKGKILFKLKVLEKFSMALVAPCSQDSERESQQDCSCYRAEILPRRVENAYALTSAETQKPSLDNKRAQLVADIMQSEEMKEILSKENASLKTELNLENVEVENYNANEENLKRLKNLQENYDDLMTCYEALKHEKSCLQIRCRKYEELEKEVESLQSQLREYNALWNEKEHYRKRSEDIDSLKEQYLVLFDETSNLETELKAEAEINSLKTKTIDELRNDNLALDKKLNEAAVCFEKERSCMQCKIKECECTIMCQKQQIKSLSVQIDRLLEQDSDKGLSNREESDDIDLIDEMNSLKEQVNNLKDAVYCSEEEKQQLQKEYQNQLNLINDLRMEVEDWKSSCEKMRQRNDYLEKYTESFQDEVHKLIEKNNLLLDDNKEKSAAIENLRNIINNKSQEVNKLMEHIEYTNQKNIHLQDEIQSLHETYNNSLSALDAEKIEALQIAKQESQELLEKVKDYDNLVQRQDSMTHSLLLQNEEYIQLKSIFTNTKEENESLRRDLANLEKRNSLLLREIQKLQELNNMTVDNYNTLQEEKYQYRLSLELTKKDSKILEEKLHKFEDISHELELLKESHERLKKEKENLENDLAVKTIELDNINNAIQLTRKESAELENKLRNSENLTSDLMKVDDAYRKLIRDQEQLQINMEEKELALENLLEDFKNLQQKNNRSNLEVDKLSKDLISLKQLYHGLLAEKDVLKSDLDNKNAEINNLYDNLEEKIEENRKLSQQMKSLEQSHKIAQNNMNTLEEENFSSKNEIDALKKESDELVNRVKYCETLQSEYQKLKNEYDKVIAENNSLQKDLIQQMGQLKKLEQDNLALNSESQILLSHSEDLEKALINARSEPVKTSTSIDPHYDIIKEIEDMKKEKIRNLNKIRELNDKLDASANTILDLSDDILARDDTISILQNHINKLKDEVQRLHISLAQVVDTGEQIKDNSYQKIKESLQSMEAHHSRATHNMKNEIANLQNENLRLEEKLSISKINSEDSIKDKHKYISQIVHLQNERQIIAAEIKQLEIKSLDDSALSPENYELESIITSLDRIRRYLDSKNSMSLALEQTLQKVQNSYQLVQDKADEAKKIVEKEKHKILNEKEEAIRDRSNMEKQLLDLKKQLENQVSHDKNVIKDLEAEILNQKLIIDKLNKSTQNYISKLNEEIQSLKEVYRSSLEKISDLEVKLNCVSDEKNTQLSLLQSVTKQLQDKNEEVNVLQKELDGIKNKIKYSASAQTLKLNFKNVAIQTDKEPEIIGRYENNLIQNMGKNNYDNITDTKKPSSNERKQDQKEQIKHVNEVQVLTANIEPTFDYVKSSYLNYKLQHLSPGRLEQYSISCPNDDVLENENISNTISMNAINDTDSTHGTENKNVIDIYNKRRSPLDTNSSKILVTERDLKTTNPTHKIDYKGLTTESCDTKSNTHHETSNLFGSVSGLSTGDKDLFVIYKDSETNYGNKPYDKKSWQTSGRSGILVEAVKIYPDNEVYDKKEEPRNQQEKPNPDSASFLYQDEDIDDDSVKQKLKIKMPRVPDNDSPTIDTISDVDKKSLDSYSMSIYPDPKNIYESSNAETSKNLKDKDYKTQSEHSIYNDETQYLETFVSTEEEHLIPHLMKKQKSDRGDRKNFDLPLGVTQVDESVENISPTSTFIKNQNKSESRHRLSRVDADVQLLIRSPPKSPRMENKKGRYGLDYILDTTLVDPDNINTYNAAQRLRETRSDEFYNNTMKISSKSGASPSILSEFQKSSTDYKSMSSKSPVRDQSKKNTEGFIMVKSDTLAEYENRIKELSTTLENIERDYKKKIDAIKMQYDSNIKSILNEHNKGVKNIQGLHEETLQDILRRHENEVENLRSMSIEAMKKVEKLEKENRCLKCKMQDSGLEEEPIKIPTPEGRKRRRSRVDTKMLSKTNVEAFNVRPKSRSNGPCTCSLDVNLSDTIRNIFEQVDAEQRKLAEQTYLKFIANKILNSNVEALDCQELSFLHLKVCRIWKVKLTKEESLQKRIDSLEAELMHKQRHTQQNMAELDRKVAEERRRLQEVREAVCRNVPTASRYDSPDTEGSYLTPLPPTPAFKKSFVSCSCNDTSDIGERRSAGDLAPASCIGLRGKRGKTDNRAVLARMDAEERREKKVYHDELPTRLRRAHDRTPLRSNKK